jgi:hypothetical protein
VAGNKLVGYMSYVARQASRTELTLAFFSDPSRNGDWTTGEKRAVLEASSHGPRVGTVHSRACDHDIGHVLQIVSAGRRRIYGSIWW